MGGILHWLQVRWVHAAGVLQHESRRPGAHGEVAQVAGRGDHIAVEVVAVPQEPIEGYLFALPAAQQADLLLLASLAEHREGIVEPYPHMFDRRIGGDDLAHTGLDLD